MYCLLSYIYIHVPCTYFSDSMNLFDSQWIRNLFKHDERILGMQIQIGCSFRLSTISSCWCFLSTWPAWLQQKCTPEVEKGLCLPTITAFRGKTKLAVKLLRWTEFWGSSQNRVFPYGIFAADITRSCRNHMDNDIWHLPKLQCFMFFFA